MVRAVRAWRWPEYASLARAMCDLRKSRGGRAAWRLVGEAIDDAHAATDAELGQILAASPPLTGDSAVDAVVAALAEWLAVERCLSIPEWTQDGERVARPWWFVSDSPRYHRIALFESPICFARRGIFTTRGGLERR